ncbi:hypothetical protein VitviT2T_024224 [Vitis vinifera]|uniref:Uncharacterized protein n=1 Tax=Vitis vinifera TaxID=29760 RepID=A0ABY9DH57_VITVI|nr:hypothetical protein VitviT2T_024224 [Vitis vinifera]
MPKEWGVIRETEHLKINKDDDDNGSTFSNVVNPNDFLSFSEPELEEILEDISWSAPIWAVPHNFKCGSITTP